MPYATNAQLPDRIRKYLPQHAQDIFRAAFNAAYERYGPRNEDRAFRIAWGGVKQNYVQLSAGIWVRRPARARVGVANLLRDRGGSMHAMRRHQRRYMLHVGT
jgi:cation transport regulator